jgi:AAA domain, putative AbiEii toxin, Type IV TA system
MYISQVKIENIRCFGSGEHAVNLDLRRPDGSYAGWTVIAGRNGAGKTTFLQAIALAAAGSRTGVALRETLSEWYRHGAEHGSVDLGLLLHAGDDETTWPQTVVAAWEMSTDDEWQETPQKQPESTAKEEDFDRLWTTQPVWRFIAGYGPFRRLTGETADAQRLRKASRRISRLVSLFREDVALGDSVEWLKEINHRKLEGDAEARELEQRILALLDDGLLPDGTRVRKVDSRGLWLEQSGLDLTIHDLSDGYRTVIALILDIARQMHECYGKLPWVAGQDRLAVNLPGVVLIDEVDAHLHVSWQQRIGFWLKERFPRVQFLVTTHSPFICQAADRRGLIRLPAPGEARTAEHVPEELYYRVVNGSADDAVLSDLFGLEHSRSPVAEAKLEEAAALEAKILVGTATAQDEQRHEELMRELPAGPDTEMERAIRSLDKTLEARVPDEHAES